MVLLTVSSFIPVVGSTSGTLGGCLVKNTTQEDRVPNPVTFQFLPLKYQILLGFYLSKNHRHEYRIHIYITSRVVGVVSNLFPSRFNRVGLLNIPPNMSKRGPILCPFWVCECLTVCMYMCMCVCVCECAWRYEMLWNLCSMYIIHTREHLTLCMCVWV
jgi:hypothetical protein